MTRFIWITKTGLDARQTNMDVISNNLANITTNGFKAPARGI
ncbi:MAG: Flagellar basal-body rod protein FlgG [Sodalis sp.]|nr:MAG: Flagellar basal-body rod protein FlgG [Sodalis sp.]